nr:MAG TPA: hypothetical protein [Caudoviricetes sp.]
MHLPFNTKVCNGLCHTVRVIDYVYQFKLYSAIQP